MKKHTSYFTSTLINLILAFMVFLALIPFLYMIFTSFRQVYSAGDLNFRIQDFNLNNYKSIFNSFPFFQYFFNSTLVSAFSCFLNVMVATLAGYGFAKKEFPGREIIFFFFLATLMVPGQVIIIPIYVIMNKLNLLNTYIALILPTVGAFGVFLMRQFMVNIPDELIEAAKIDGCKELTLFFKIIIPLIKPVIISLTIFILISVWNDLIWPLVVVSDKSRTTLTLGLSVLQGVYRTNYGLLMAGSTLTFLPPFLMYIFFQNKFVEGIALTGIKG